MTDHAPILIAKAVLAEIQAKTDWTIPIEADLSWGDYAEDFENLGNDLICDVIPHAIPTLMLSGRVNLQHDCKTVVGLRRRIEHHQRDSTGRAIPVDEVGKYVNQLYEVGKYFLPSTANPMGRRLSTLVEAVFVPPLDIVQIYDPEKLKTGLYQGLIRLTYRYVEAA